MPAKQRRMLILEDTGERRLPEDGEWYIYLGHRKGIGLAMVAENAADKDAPRFDTSDATAFVILKLVRNDFYEEWEARRVMEGMAK